MTRVDRWGTALWLLPEKGIAGCPGDLFSSFG